MLVLSSRELAKSISLERPFRFFQAEIINSSRLEEHLLYGTTNRANQQPLCHVLKAWRLPRFCRQDCKTGSFCHVFKLDTMRRKSLIGSKSLECG